MAAVAHFMENGNFLCGYMGSGMVFEAETEEDVTCPECKKIIELRKRKRKTGLYDNNEE